jgi:hypothetical protein
MEEVHFVQDLATGAELALVSAHPLVDGGGGHFLASSRWDPAGTVDGGGIGEADGIGDAAGIGDAGGIGVISVAI